MNASSAASVLRPGHRLPPGTLLADIGGTNARFLIVDDSGQERPVHVLAVRNHASFESALHAFKQSAGAPAFHHAAIAVACPVLGDNVSFTNLAWEFSIDALRQTLGLETLRVANDAAAIANALPALTDDDFDVWQTGSPPQQPCPLAMVAPGTGLGVAGLIPVRTGSDEFWQPVAGEGGHASLAAHDSVDARIITELRTRFGHVSAERVASGPGIANIYAALMARDGIKGAAPAPEEVTARMRTGDDALAAETFELFTGFLAGVAADAVLTFGARSGLFLAGGILPLLGADFKKQRFLARLADKGRFRALLEAVPVALVRHPYPALAGLAAMVESALVTETAATG